MSTTSRRLILATALLLAVAPALARAQSCGITGPSSFCGATARLCGPSGAYERIWGGPGIAGYDGDCIIVDTPGTYTLQTIDLMTGLISDPCVFILTRGAGPAATIGGDPIGCAGSAVTLCGPDGAWRYTWSGPDGFAATTRCIDAVAAGDYSLVVSDDASGCVGDPATVAVSFRDCTPPPAPAATCPRPAAWWSDACAGANPGIDAGALARIAACADDRSVAVAWAGDPAGFCGAMHRHPGDIRARAIRQFVAVLADVCARAAALPASAGAVGLDPATALTAPGSGTVADWLAATDARLVALAGRHGPGVRDTYREIIRSAWAIAHGRGIGPVCPEDSAGAVSATRHAVASDDVLAEELSDAGDGPTARLEVGTNPARGAARMSLSVDQPATDIVVGVYDLTGRRVRELARGAFAAGTIELSWDGRDASGTPMPNGVYFVQMRVDGVRTQSRLTLLR